MGFVGKDDQLILATLVAHPEQTLLYVSHYDPLTDGVDACHQVGDLLETRDDIIKQLNICHQLTYYCHMDFI